MRIQLVFDDHVNQSIVFLLEEDRLLHRGDLLTEHVDRETIPLFGETLHHLDSIHHLWASHVSSGDPAHEPTRHPQREPNNG